VDLLNEFLFLRFFFLLSPLEDEDDEDGASRLRFFLVLTVLEEDDDKDGVALILLEEEDDKDVVVLILFRVFFSSSDEEHEDAGLSDGRFFPTDLPQLR